MRIFTTKTISDFIQIHPESRTALQEWVKKVKSADWKNFADIKKTFNSVDSVGNQRYVFNIKGNTFRIIVIVRFTPGFVYVRFIGTHAEYDKISDCSIQVSQMDNILKYWHLHHREAVFLSVTWHGAKLLARL